jgi:hypothetical protein
MGFNKMYLPELAVLKKDLTERGHDGFTETWVKRYEKADAILGSVESLRFLEQFINNEYNGTKTNQTIIE